MFVHECFLLLLGRLTTVTKIMAAIALEALRLASVLEFTRCSVGRVWQGGAFLAALGFCVTKFPTERACGTRIVLRRFGVTQNKLVLEIANFSD